MLSATGPAEIYRHSFLSHWDSETLVTDRLEPITSLTAPNQNGHLLNFTQWMMYLDAFSYLPDDILVKVDRATSFVEGVDVSGVVGTRGSPGVPSGAL